MSLLEVENLRVSFPTRSSIVEAVRGVSFTLGRERLGIVGESGSGKSQTGRAIMGLTPPHADVWAERLRFDGIDLLAASPHDRRRLRGRRIAMVLQDPRHALNPVMTIGAQLAETFQVHHRLEAQEAGAEQGHADAQDLSTAEGHAGLHACIGGLAGETEPQQQDQHEGGRGVVFGQKTAGQGQHHA